MKPPVYTLREQEVLDSPAGYILHVYTGQSQRKECPKIFTAKEAYEQSKLVEEMYPNYRCLVYACRQFVVGGEREMRLAHVRRSDLWPLFNA